MCCQYWFNWAKISSSLTPATGSVVWSDGSTGSLTYSPEKSVLIPIDHYEAFKNLQQLPLWLIINVFRLLQGQLSSNNNNKRGFPSYKQREIVLIAANFSFSLFGHALAQGNSPRLRLQSQISCKLGSFSLVENIAIQPKYDWGSMI